MKGLSDTERRIVELQVGATASADERILSDAFAALEESLRTEQAGISPGIRQTIARSTIIKLAGAAVIIIAVLLGARLFTVPKPEEPPSTLPPAVKPAERAQLESIMEMFLARDVNGLVAMLSQGQFKSQVLAAICLGEIGDDRALPELMGLYLSAEENLPEGYTENPFAGPIEKIIERTEAEQAKSRIEADANKIPEGDANKGGMAYPPAPTEKVLDLRVINKQTGGPLAGVKLDIQIVKDGSDEEREEATDEQGWCRIELGERETNYVRIETQKEGFVPVQVVFRRDKEGAQIPESYTLVLERGTSIGGFVQNEEGEPIEWVTVYLMLVSRTSAGVNERVFLVDHQEKTDASGFWQCTHVPAQIDDIGIRLAHADYMDDEAYGVTKKPSTEELRQMVGVMVMRKGLDVVGRVLDSNGQPIEGARVGQGSDRYGTYYPTVKTGAEGRFKFAQSRPGQMVLTVQAKGYAPDLKEFAAHADMEPVEFYLRRGRIIRGRVVDSNDKPISNVFVSADTWRGHRSIDWNSKTDSEGRFRWDDAPEDEVFFMVAGREYVTISGLALSASAQEHIIEMHRPLRVRGNVIDAVSKAPVRSFKLIPGTKSKSDGRVGWSRGQAAAFSNGSYEFEFNYAGDLYTILIEAERYQPGISRVFDIAEEQAVFDFELQRGEGPSGVVYLPSGEAAVNVEVALCTASAGAHIRNGQFFQKQYQRIIATGANGRFSFPPQTETYLLVAVGDEGYAKVTEEDFEWAGHIILQPWGRVEGVVRIGGKPGAKEDLWLDSELPAKYAVPRVRCDYQTVSDAQGKFVFERVVPGTARVVHEKRRVGQMSDSRVAPVEVVAGETVSVVIGGQGRTVVGRVAVPADYGKPINWANGYHCLSRKPPEPPTPEGFEQMPTEERLEWIETWEASEEGRRFEKSSLENRQAYGVYIDHEGKFRVEDVPAGTYNLQAAVWERAKEREYWIGAVIGTLNYEFAVPDVNEQTSDEVLDIGTLELEIKKHLKVGDFAPAFEAETFDGKTVNLADFSGRVVLLSFWSSRDPQSVEKLLQVEGTYRSFGRDTRLVMIAVSLDDDLEDTRDLLKNKQLKCINCFADEKTRGIASRDYGAARVTVYAGYERLTFPCLFVIGPKGAVLSRNPSSEQLESTLDAALGM
ncbi:MAG TPA: carboxypeptidase regulatory-like domain-containing protein [Sedimentisphaerales bacterium]|nr:carboxypeptidase regulatory-like domain-containing protein [Sedimentisphaerales bacterium]